MSLLVFLLFLFCVEQRQKIVTNMIVSTLLFWFWRMVFVVSGTTAGAVIDGPGGGLLRLPVGREAYCVQRLINSS